MLCDNLMEDFTESEEVKEDFAKNHACRGREDKEGSPASLRGWREERRDWSVE